MIRYVILILILILLPIDNLPASDPQIHAQREVRLMAESQTVAHLLGCAPNARFSGVGRSRDPYPKTCYPWEHGSNARKIIADAIYHYNGWYYRSTHWQ